MKTGFVKAYVNIPGNKAYKYHGINSSCDIQPDPDPLYYSPFPPPGPFWILEIDKYFSCSYQYCYLYQYKNSNWLNSSDNDPCVKKWPGGKKQYYYMWLYIVGKSQLFSFSWNRGSQCDYGLSYYLPGPTTFQVLENIWADSTVILRSFNAGVGSHVKIWRSETGELPPNPPI